MKKEKQIFCKTDHRGLVINSCQCCGSTDDGIRKTVFMYPGQPPEIWCLRCYQDIDDAKNKALLFEYGGLI